MDAKQDVNVQSGVFHIAPVFHHGLFKVGPGLGVILFVQDGPVVEHALGVWCRKTQLHHSTRGCLHCIHAGTPGHHGKVVFVLFPMEHRDLLLVNVQDWSQLCEDLGGGVVGQDLPALPAPLLIEAIGFDILKLWL